jgi:hypothetical protein
MKPTKRGIERRLESLEESDDVDEFSLCMVLSEPDRYEDVEGYDYSFRDKRTGEVGRVPWVKNLEEAQKERSDTHL